MINGEDDYPYVVENGNGLFFDDGGFDEFNDFLEDPNSKSATFNYPNVDIPHLDYLTTDDLPQEASTSFLKKVKNNAFHGQPSFEDSNHFDDVEISTKKIRFADGKFERIEILIFSDFQTWEDLYQKVTDSRIPCLTSTKLRKISLLQNFLMGSIRTNGHLKKTL